MGIYKGKKKVGSVKKKPTVKMRRPKKKKNTNTKRKSRTYYV